MPLKLQGRVEVCLIAPGPLNLRLLLLKQVFRIRAWQFPNNFYPDEFVKNICKLIYYKALSIFLSTFRNIVSILAIKSCGIRGYLL